jgi:hypothetical protein
MNKVSQAVRFAPTTEEVVDVEAALTFITPQDSKPFFHSSAITGGEPRIFFANERHTVPIRNLRPLAPSLSLDREGFVLRRHRSTVTDFYDDTAIAQVYYPEIEALLRRELGASRVIIFDTTRRSDAKGGAANPDGTRGPASRVHVDYTVTSGPKRIRDLVGDEEADRLSASGARIVQINVWRPITGPVRRSPLALADASSVRPEELVATDQIFPDRIGEIYSLAYAPTQRWYYAPEITPDEVILIKGWDSDPARARFTPHGAFALPNTPADAPARESIELRTYAVIE